MLQNQYQQVGQETERTVEIVCNKRHVLKFITQIPNPNQYQQQSGRYVYRCNVCKESKSISAGFWKCDNYNCHYGICQDCSPLEEDIKISNIQLQYHQNKQKYIVVDFSETIKQDKIVNTGGPTKLDYGKSKDITSPHLDLNWGDDDHRDRIPPILDYCEWHLKATKISKILSEEVEDDYLIERQSGKYIDNTPVPLNVNLNQFAKNVGAGYAMYFQYVKWCSLILVCVLCTEGGLNIWENYHAVDPFCKSDHDPTLLEQADEQSDPSETNPTDGSHAPCILNHATEFSIINKLNNSDAFYAGLGMNVGTVLFVILIFQILRKVQRDTAVKMDEIQTTPGDYTIMVSNFPRVPDLKKSIIKWATDEVKSAYKKNNTTPTPRVMDEELSIVKKVNLAYDLDDYNKLVKDKIKLIDNLQAIKKQVQAYPQPTQARKKELLDQANAKIQKVKAALNAEEREFEHGELHKKTHKDYFTGIAFVTFEYIEDQQNVLKAWKRSGFKDWYLYSMGWSIQSNIAQTYSYHCNGNEIRNVLKVEQAPDCTSIQWENLKYSLTQAKVARFFGDCFSYIILGICWAGIFFLMQLAEDQQNHFITFGIGLVITLVNVVCRKVMAFSASFGLFQTQEAQDYNMIQKIVCAQFLNTTMITFLFKYFKFDTDAGAIWGKAGLIPQVYALFLSQLITIPLFKLLDFGYLMNSNTRDNTRQDIKYKKCFLTQEEAHKIFEYPKISVTYCYVNITKLMLFTMFYQGVMPLGSLYALLTFFLCYHIEKYKMLRWRSYGKCKLSSEIAINMVELLEFCVIFYGLSIFMFDALFSRIDTLEHSPASQGLLCFNYLGNTHCVNKTSMLCMIVGILNAILPMDELNKAIFGQAVEKIDPCNFSEYDNDFDFETDYDFENPGTKDIAFEDQKKRQDAWEEQKKFDQKFQNDSNKEDSDSLIYQKTNLTDDNQKRRRDNNKRKRMKKRNQQTPKSAEIYLQEEHNLQHSKVMDEYI